VAKYYWQGLLLLVPWVLVPVARAQVSSPRVIPSEASYEAPRLVPTRSPQAPPQLLPASSDIPPPTVVPTVPSAPPPDDAPAPTPAVLQRVTVAGDRLALELAGATAATEVWRSPDGRTVSVRLAGTTLSPQFPDPNALDLAALGVRSVTYREIATDGSAVRLDIALDEVRDWSAVEEETGIALVPAEPAEAIARTPEVQRREFAETAPARAEADAAAARQQAQVEAAERAERAAASPLYGSPTVPTAEQYEGGDVSVNVRNRLFSIPDDTVSGTPAYPNVGVTWGITDDIELNLEIQRLDTASPGRQGDFRAIRDPNLNDFFLSEFQELTVEGQYRIWDNADESLALGGVLALSFGSRPISFRQGGEVVEERLDESVVPSLQLPLTAVLGGSDRWRLTISPAIAFFREENAMHVHRPPGSDEDFGTTFGFTGAASFRAAEQFVLFADAFVPLTGNNAIDRDSGEPSKTPAFNAGARYLVNPRLALDAYVTNTLGTVGPLALTADEEFVAFGAGITVLPSFLPGNRRYPNTFRDTPEDYTTYTSAGFAAFDGGVLPQDQFALSVGGGMQGFVGSLRYSPVRDLEIGTYLDYASGTTDESEQGVSGKVRIFDQQAGDFLTASVAATIGITNEPFANFFENDRDTFDDRDLDKSVPVFLFDQDSLSDGRLYITTIALPLHYKFASEAAIWFTPIVAFVQQGGADIAGFNVGGSYPVARDIDLIAELGANFADPGNGFDGDRLSQQIPYSLGIRRDISDFFGANPTDATAPWLLEVYLTNRVGNSTFHSLRVREDDFAIGVGLTIPFRF